MGNQSIVARPLAVEEFASSSDTKYTPAFDIGDATELHALVKVTAIDTGDMTVEAEHSLDGLFWESVADLSITFAAGDGPDQVTGSVKSSAVQLGQYLRFVSTMDQAGDATYEIQAFIKNGSERR